MSRMFSALTGAGRIAEREPPPAVEPDDGFVGSADDTPFVEVGGSAGPVFFAGSQVAVAEPVAPAQPAVAPPAPRAYPRLANTPAYLSVRFHTLTGGAKAKAAPDGPDAGLVALHFPDHPVSAEYRTLRDEIRRQLPEATPRVLFFTAAAGEAGTTTVLLNLAITLALEGTQRVLVVDANVSNAGVGPKFTLEPAPGLAEVVAQQVPLAWAARPSVVPNLQLLTTGVPTAETPALVGQELPKLADQLRQWYDWVLVDAGIWGDNPERDSACPSADAVYLVSRERDADRSEFAGLRGWVRELGGLLRGYITTRV